LQPQLAAVHYHLGNLLADLGRLDEAVQSHRLALTLAPGHAEVHANLGVCLLALNRVDEAVDALREAAALQPAEALVHGNLGNALMAQGHMAQARASLEQAVALRPDLVLARSNLAHLLKTIGEPEGALAQLEAALGLEPEQLALRSEVLFMRQYLPHPLSHPLSTLAIAAGLRRVWRRSGPGALPTGGCRRSPSGPLRIGLVSGDLRSHPVGYFLESVLAALSTAAADRVAIHAYANQRQTDDVSLRLQQTCAAWLEVADLDDAALAQRIHSDGIDVLVDLSGHTRNNRLAMLAWKPAPVQVSWLGYCGTTGVDLVDAFLADPWIAPAGIEPDYVEPIVRLPESFLCFTPPAAPMIVGPLPALSARAVHFGCFNHLAKMNDAVVAVWAKILRAVPGSRLLLQSLALQDPAIQRSVAERFGRHGIDAARLGLQPAQSRDDYLAAYRRVDIALDPFPYPGGTTTLEALWMGVPVLTLPAARRCPARG
jgi:predicted O-linked N-acetylglucosamine transferase (SPINDLY family)